MKAKDMREKPIDDLRELEKSLTRDVFQAKLKNFTNRLDDTSQIKKTRRDLARVKTLLGEHGRKSAVAAAEPAASPPAKPARAKAAAKKPATKTKTARSEASQ
jgi:large subunit ribosomal protein L29